MHIHFPDFLYHFKELWFTLSSSRFFLGFLKYEIKMGKNKKIHKKIRIFEWMNVRMKCIFTWKNNCIKKYAHKSIHANIFMLNILI